MTVLVRCLLASICPFKTLKKPNQNQHDSMLLLGFSELSRVLTCRIIHHTLFVNSCCLFFFILFRCWMFMTFFLSITQMVGFGNKDLISHIMRMNGTVNLFKFLLYHTRIMIQVMCCHVVLKSKHLAA